MYIKNTAAIPQTIRISAFWVFAFIDVCKVLLLLSLPQAFHDKTTKYKLLQMEKSFFDYMGPDWHKCVQ